MKKKCPSPALFSKKIPVPGQKGITKNTSPVQEHFLETNQSSKHKSKHTKATPPDTLTPPAPVSMQEEVTPPDTLTPPAPVPHNVSEYITALLESPLFAGLITCHRVMEGKKAQYAATARPWPRAMHDILHASGITGLYTHQATAIDAVRAGKNVVVATPTASGKSLIYTLPIIEQYLQNPDSRSLFLFPLKALAQDQLMAFKALTAHWPEEARPKAAVYDGDTTPHFRKKIREHLPAALFTNPEMLHLAMLPHHHAWSTLFAGLSLVVVDEVHTYRGLLGTHMAQVFRRLMRIAALYGASPSFVFCSATVQNPVELASLLTGITPVPVLESAAPQGRRHFLFINPDSSPASTAITLLKSALARGLRTIVYCQSRRMTELISLWASTGAGPYTGRISAYRAGYLPAERRDIEARMASGELLAVISTSALELGIDIGTLDVCLLVGYPGTVMSTMQRGGRVGRNLQESAVVLIAQEDALDQYIVRHPEDFFARPPETAVLNPENPVILARHLECAAAELPLRRDRPIDANWIQKGVLEVVKNLEQQSILLRSADGTELLAGRKRPQRYVSLRGSGSTVAITNEKGDMVGSVDGIRALREAHPGAVYLHRGQYFEITELDLPGGVAKARSFRPPWYTKPRSTKDTEILSIEKSRIIGNMAVQYGRLQVTDMVTGYEKRDLKTGQLLGVVPLTFSPQVFETEGFWFMVPRASQDCIEDAHLHFMGAIHALEHAAIGILPLLVMTDRNDFGGISKPMHLQTGRPTIFVYDGMPGGAGLSCAAFADAKNLFARIHEVMADCPCELGCPSCVHSPKCGSGNRPIDKAGALRLLTEMLCPDPASLAEAKALIAAPLFIPETNSRPGLISSARTAAHLSWDSVLDAVLTLPGTAALTNASTLPSAASDSDPSNPDVPASGFDGSRYENSDPNTHASNSSATDKPVPGTSPPAFQRIPGNAASAAAAMYADIMTATPLGADGHIMHPSMVAKHSKEPFIQPGHTQHHNRPSPALRENITMTVLPASGPLPEHFIVLDVETRNSAEDVGGWHKTKLMGVSIAVLYDSRTDTFTSYTQETIPDMAEVLRTAPLVVGFNIIKFDYPVLEPHAPGFTFRALPTLDMLSCVHEQLSYRVSLDNLATATLDAPKSASGLLALKWWKEQKLDLIEKYCTDDVRLTRDLFLYGRTHGYVLFSNKAKQKVRVRASWCDTK